MVRSHRVQDVDCCFNDSKTGIVTHGRHGLLCHDLFDVICSDAQKIVNFESRFSISQFTLC